MFEKLRKRGAIAAALALAIAGLGAAPALAEDEVPYAQDPEKAYLTKVIVAPSETNTSGDEYTFSFAGGGTVSLEGSKLMSDGVAQDKNTLKEGDVVPSISDKKIQGLAFESDDSNVIGTATSSRQAAVQLPLSEVLDGVVFPHAGVYTYLVTEQMGTTSVAGSYVSYSQASYLMRVAIQNDKDALGNEILSINGITVEKQTNEDGAEAVEKADPCYPEVDGTKITKVDDQTNIDSSNVAGDGRGRNVPGFTFANEYVKGGELVVTKLTKGQFADKTKEFPVELLITDTAAPDGSVITYMINGGTDQTENVVNGKHTQLDGVAGVTDYMVEFNDGTATIKADLKDNGSVVVTALYGTYSEAGGIDNSQLKPGAGTNDHRQLFTEGLKQDTSFTVTENASDGYVAYGYVDPGTKPDADLSASTSSPTPDPNFNAANGVLAVTGTVGEDGTQVYVLNLYDDTQVSPTGIFIDNLPYILMVGVPLVVFAGLFVARRRGNAVA